MSEPGNRLGDKSPKIPCCEQFYEKWCPKHGPFSPTRTYSESEVREKVAKAHEYCANKWQDYEYPYRFFMELAADIRSGKEPI